MTYRILEKFGIPKSQINATPDFKFEFWRPSRSEQGSLAAVPQHEKDKQKKTRHRQHINQCL